MCVSSACVFSPRLLFLLKKGRGRTKRHTHAFLRFFAMRRKKTNNKTLSLSVSEAPKPKHTYLIERNPALNSHSERYRATVTRKVTVVVVLLRYRGDSGDRLFHRPRTRARSGADNEKKWKRKEKMSRRNPGHSHQCPPQEEARSPQLTSRRSYGRLSCILHSQSSL